MFSVLRSISVRQRENIRKSSLLPWPRRQSRKTQYLLAIIGKVKSVGGLINFGRLYSHTMIAFGMIEMLFLMVLIREVLEAGVCSAKRFSKTQNYSRAQQLASVIDFAGEGANTTYCFAHRQTTVNKCSERILETRIDRDGQGAQIDRYCQRNTPQITSARSILGLKIRLTVVRTALGLPSSTTSLDSGVQPRTITHQFKISDSRNPRKLQKVIQRGKPTRDSQNAMAATVPPAPLPFITFPGKSSDLLLCPIHFRLASS